MISIVVCSRTAQLEAALLENIEQTIGVEHEVVAVDNSKNEMSIFDAYDFGVSKAKGDLVVFMHSDVKFLCNDWGKVCEDAFTDPRIGASGILGGYSMTAARRSWFDSKYRCGGEIHDWGTPAYNPNWSSGKPLGNHPLIVDGVFMVIRKTLFDDGLIKWDTKSYKGFHFYDLDICMQVYSAGYDCRLLDILVEHKSLGVLNKQFFDSCIVFHDKWDKVFPVMARGIDSKILQEEVRYDLEERNKLYAENEANKNILRLWPMRLARKFCHLLKKC